MRYYLHGDQKEDDASLWFCARCDLFVAEINFSQSHHDESRVTHYDRYVAEKSRLPTYMKNTEGKYRRPANPPNCLA